MKNSHKFFRIIRNTKQLNASVSFLLLFSISMPWQAFADDVIFREIDNYRLRNYNPDSSQVSNSGAYTRTYPIVLPPGRKNATPDLQISYSSQNTRQDSLVGYGWSLNIPYIERVNKIGVDRLYNQDLQHTFFTSSISGELVPLGTTTPVNGSFLGVSLSTPKYSFFSLPSFLDFSTSTATDTISVFPDISVSTTTTILLISSTTSDVIAASTTERATPSSEEFASTTINDTILTIPFPATSSAPVSSLRPRVRVSQPYWAYSQELVMYDTKDGNLHPGEYALQPDGKTFIAYVATTTVTTATSTYDIPAHLSGFDSTSTFLGMTQVHDVGRQYVDAFTDGENIFKTPTTHETYRNLNVRGVSEPKYIAPVSTTAILDNILSLNFVTDLLKSIAGVKTAYAAIVYDNAASYTACVTGTSCTYSYTVSGTDSLLVCMNSNYGTLPGATTMSYGGATMTPIGSQQIDTSAGNNYSVDTFYLKGATAGVNNLVISTTNSMTNGFYAHCSSYSGVDQFTPIETNNQHAVGYNSCVTDTASVTTTTDNDWIIGIWGDDAGRVHTAGTGTLRTTDGQGVIIDKGPITPPGTATVQNVNNAGTGCTVTAIAIRPRTLSTGALQVESQTNPTIVATSNPRFSAVYQTVASTTGLATSYQIQVTASSTSWSSLFWDSGQQTLSSSTPDGMRTPQIYSSTTFPLDRTKYYWRMRLWDQSGVSTSWSDTRDYFIMSGNIDYSAKVETGDFLRYTSMASDTWFAIDKRGITYTYGATSTSRLAGANSTSTFRWMLDSVTDPNGNSINYSYTINSGQVYPSKITYTNTATTTGVGEVDFVYEGRTDIATSSIAGAQFTTKQRLKTILVYTNNLLTHQYQLTYTTGDNGIRSLLSGIQETGWNSSFGTTTLPVTVFGYSTSTYSWTENTDSNKWQFPTPGYFVDERGGDLGYRVLDANGDGRVDLVHGTTAAYLNNGSTWVQSSGYVLPVLSTSVDDGVRLADVNGDGIVDQLYGTKGNPDSRPIPADINNVYLGSTGGWGLSSMKLPSLFATTFNNGGQSRFPTRLVDVNGDGLADVIDDYNAVDTSDGAQWVRDSRWTVPVSFPAAGFSYWNQQTIDVNGDGLLDIVGVNGVYLNTSSGWILTPWTMPFGLQGDERFGDINNDGLIDVVKGTTVYVNTGAGWAAAGSVPVAPYYSPGGMYVPQDRGVSFDDINGDGLTDAIQSTYYYGTNYVLIPIKHVYVKNGNRPDLLTSVTNERGGNTSVTYKQMTMVFPVEVVNSVVTTPGFGGATSTIGYDYAEGEYFTHYSFPVERRFLGFRTTTATDSMGNVTTSYFHQRAGTDGGSGEYNDDLSKAGKAYRIEKKDSSSNVFSRLINKWARADYGDGRNFVKLVQTMKQIFDGDASHRDTVATTTYDDSNGNVLTQVNYGEVSGNTDGTFSDIGNDLLTAIYSYAASTTNSMMSLPSRELVTDQSGSSVKDTKWTYDTLGFGYVSKGNQTNEERLKLGTTYASTTRTYDGYGNVLTMTDPRGYTSTTTYDTYNLYPTTTTNALGQIQRYVYDYATGKVATTTDVNSRVFVTKYDGLGRAIEEDQPDFLTPTTLVPKTKYTYNDSTTSPSSVYQQTYLSAATTSNSYTYLDGLGRTVQSKKEAEATNGWVTSDTIYNNIGLVGAQSFPYFSGSSSWGNPTNLSYLYTNTTYDPESRPSVTADVIGTTTNTYNDWTLTVTDPMGNKKDYTKDAYGNLAQVTEYLSPTVYATTTYSWNRLGKLTKLTDAAGNVRNFTYDTLGQLLTSEDLHSPSDTLFGTTTYTYDNAGNMVTILNPRNQTINYVYDKLNRPTSEDYAGGSGTEVSYTYDTDTNGIGRLYQSVRQGGATTTYTYNPVGLVGTTSTKIGTTWATTTTSYLRNGLVDTTIYPNNEQVWNLYNDAGDLNRVFAKKPASTTWQKVIESTSYSPNGLPSFIDYGNNTQTTWTYDATQKYRLTHKVTVSTSTTPGVPENLSL